MSSSGVSAGKTSGVGVGTSCSLVAIREEIPYLRDQTRERQALHSQHTNEDESKVRSCHRGIIESGRQN
jgi:hypothetical protein